MLRDMSDTLAFIEVAERGCFTAAAESLRTSKARISKKVQDLEQRLGVQLFHRTTRTIRLTEAGTIYFERCRGLVRLISDAESAVGSARVPVRKCALNSSRGLGVSSL
ncbi:Cyn operon transcriptional activator [Pannonibacter phragmitetus]|uniref:Cyn operon transcriptional activator n=2 Tax=Pannonibacter phragmitetus TaxID=121719 RepID=A0A378ZUD3_9HYPH|nr:Cyn operon transcriptional activator [Pannonibacter phragmitetus]